MFCLKCGVPLTDNAKVCVKCGEMVEQINQEKIEHISVPPKYAGFGLRVVAALIDIIILCAVIRMINVFIPVPASLDDPFKQGQYLGKIDFYIYCLCSFFYATLMESSKYSATLGKMAVNIKVVDTDNNRLAFTKAACRHIAKTLSYFTLGIGFILATFTDKKQSLHDKISNCLVIKKC